MDALTPPHPVGPDGRWTGGSRDEQGRLYLAVHDSAFGGETRLTAGDCRDWIANGWPERYSTADTVTPEVLRERRGGWLHRWFGIGPHPAHCVHDTLRSFTGEPLPGDPAECECACGCAWHGRWSEVDPTGGVMRCAECVAWGHPPVDRWPAAGSRTGLSRG